MYTVAMKSGINTTPVAVEIENVIWLCLYNTVGIYPFS